jgi:hypothetical protein
VHLALQRGLWGYTVYRFERIQHLKNVASVDPFLFGSKRWSRWKFRLRLIRLHRSMVLLLRRWSHLHHREFQLRIPR